MKVTFSQQQSERSAASKGKLEPKVSDEKRPFVQERPKSTVAYPPYQDDLKALEVSFPCKCEVRAHLLRYRCHAYFCHFVKYL